MSHQAAGQPAAPRSVRGTGPQGVCPGESHDAHPAGRPPLWIDIALGEIEQARKTIAAVPRKHPFQIRYHHVQKVDWESCARVLDAEERKRCLSVGWGKIR